MYRLIFTGQSDACNRPNCNEEIVKMPLSHQQVLTMCEIISQQENLKVAVRGALEGAAITGLTTLIGGLIAGPIGLAIGGTAGGVAAAIRGQGQFKSVYEIIMNEMSDGDKRKLTSAVKKVLSNIEASDIITVLAILAGNGILKGKVVEVIKSVVSKKF